MPAQRISLTFGADGRTLNAGTGPQAMRGREDLRQVRNALKDMMFGTSWRSVRPNHRRRRTAKTA